jgi:hypothetical protein
MRTLKEFIIAENVTLFTEAFVLAQNAIGEQDGGIAAAWDDTVRGYQSTFANECGAKIFETILKTVSQEEVAERMCLAATPEITKHFEDAAQLTSSAIDEIAEEVGQTWLSLLEYTFPEVAKADLVAHLPSVVETVNDYLQEQYRYSEEYEATRGMGRSGG